jgi:hypothetical protein
MVASKAPVTRFSSGRALFNGAPTVAGGSPSAQQAAQARAAGATAGTSAAASSATKPQDDVDATAVERLLDSTTVAQIVGSKMRSGETVTISSDGQVVLQVRKQGMTAYDKFKAFAGDTFSVSAAEVSNVVSQDPAFAFKESALGVQTQVFQGIPQNFQDLAQKSFLPVVRVVALALDSKKAYDTMTSKTSTMVDKFIDGGHVVTDIAGVAGAVAFAVPSIGANVATWLTVAGLLGDIAAYGYHVMKYFKDRGAPSPDGPNPDPGPPPDNPPPQRVTQSNPPPAMDLRHVVKASGVVNSPMGMAPVFGRPNYAVGK